MLRYNVITVTITIESPGARRATIKVEIVREWSWNEAMDIDPLEQIRI
jgi:hypothetical protein